MVWRSFVSESVGESFSCGVGLHIMMTVVLFVTSFRIESGSRGESYIRKDVKEWNWGRERDRESEPLYEACSSDAVSDPLLCKYFVRCYGGGVGHAEAATPASYHSKRWRRRSKGSGKRISLWNMRSSMWRYRTTTSEEGTCLIFCAALIVQSKRTRSGSRSRTNVGGFAYVATAVAEVVGLICQKGSNWEEHEGDEQEYFCQK